MTNLFPRIASFAIALALFATPFASVLADTTVVIMGNTSTGENQPGWFFNRDLSTATPYEFNADAASIGVGSLYVLPIGANASNKFIAENFINTALTNVNSISYDFQIGATGDASDKAQFYMNVYANFGVSDDLKFYDCRYNIIPTVGSNSDFTTVTFDPTQAYSVTQRNTSPFTCPAVPADMNISSAGSNIRAFALNVGDTNASDMGIEGYLDNVVVDLDSEVTVYDFEPDTDNDGVEGSNDKCPGTTPDNFSQWGGSQGRYMWNGDWVSSGKGAKGFVPTMTYTYGCSGEQILDAMSEATGLDFGGHYKFGPSKSILEDWHLGKYNLGQQILDTLVVNSAVMGGADSNIALDDEEDYTLNVSGTWTNRPGEIVDTAWTTMDGWVTQLDAPDGGYPADLLELQVGQQFQEWGTYDANHEYQLVGYSPATDGAVNFRIFDGDANTNTLNPGWYGDNVGSLTVEIVGDLWVDLW